MSVLSLVRRRIAGDFEIDEWGLDTELVEALSPVAGLRWSIETDGSVHVPAEGPALLVFNRPLGSSAPFVVGRAVRLATGRSLRVSGLPDVMVVGPILRRVGAVLADPDEITSVLRAGHLVGAGLEQRLGLLPTAGEPHHDSLVAALRLGVPIVPVGLSGNPYGRRWRVDFGPAICDHHAGAAGSGAEALAALAERVRSEVAALIGNRR